MKYSRLGSTGLMVSRLCFGSLTLGPLQNGLPIREGADILRRAFDMGVNFVDTAQLYKTYPYIKEAVTGRQGEVYVASKSYAFTGEDMERAVVEALRETGLERLGLFLLHETESEYTIQGHWPAFEYLMKAKEKGLVAGIGISTHHVAAVQAGAAIPEIDVISPLINCRGLGIADGTVEQMVHAIELAHKAGKGIYAMKPLGGGHLSGDALSSLQWFDGLPVDSIAVGMKSLAEVEFSCRAVCGEVVPAEIRQAVTREPRRLHVEDWCTGCGECTFHCAAGAIRVEKGRAAVDPSRCVFCGYCGAACPQFAIKVI